MHARPFAPDHAAVRAGNCVSLPRLRLRFAAWVLCALAGGTHATTGDGGVEAREPAGVHARVTGLAVPFLAPSDGDDRRVAFAARTSAGTVFVTRDGQLVYGLQRRPSSPRDAATVHRNDAQTQVRGWSLTESLVGARAEPRGTAASATHVSRFVGSDARNGSARCRHSTA